ncbi:uncharacterized protein P884DRAFT_293161 [Thermothelomyces heterothallicus CBS 202.75]|uniref:uncharacterized protein n=1 Tax=Thermothelomyces heterothallicus CBS 202.75 TaxID=1149848 RepID=UPI0037443C96
MRWSTSKSVVGSLEGADVVTVLVGEEQREFTIHRKLLSDSCAFFKGHIDAIPSPSRQRKEDGEEEEDSVLWLPNEAPDMFEIFVLWLYQRRRFPTFIDGATQGTCQDKLRSLRTNLVRLHLFAAIIDLPALQDAAMDAIQDMYLRFDWDMSPHFLAFLYGECDAQHAVRLRKWAVAMLAWSLHSVDKPQARHDADKLFVAYPELKADYHMHLQKMAQSRADVRIKNPQLRLPANGLRSGERLFGFRQCTFHSHRAAVGEGTCPHALALGQTPTPPPVPGPDKEEVESDKEEAEIISPVGNLNEVSYLDLS